MAMVGVLAPAGTLPRRPVTAALHEELAGIHHGIAPDPDGWMHVVGA
jgi:hypothetical protein